MEAFDDIGVGEDIGKGTEAAQNAVRMPEHLISDWWARVPKASPNKGMVIIAIQSTGPGTDITP